MAINNDYQVIEAIITDIRALVDVDVLDVIPFIPNTEQEETRFKATIESSTMMYFWVVELLSFALRPFATQVQHEDKIIRVSAYMSFSEKPAEQSSTDPKVASAFETGTSTSGSETTLTDTDKSFTTDEFANSHELWVTYADDSVRHRRILSNTADTLTVRKAFDTTVAADLSYEIFLRPTSWILWEQVRTVLDQLSLNRSLAGLVVTGSLPEVRVEQVTLYERIWSRAIFDLTKTAQVAKAWV